MAYMKPLHVFFSVFLGGVLPAIACDQPVVLSNWKSCAIGTLGTDGGKSDWDAVPQWAQSDKIKPYYFDDPRMLAKYGLCNAKFHRVVLCLLGWKDSRDKNACWYLICSGHEASRS